MDSSEICTTDIKTETPSDDEVSEEQRENRFDQVSGNKNYSSVVRNDHPYSVLLSESDGYYQCAHCKRNFISSKILQNHMKRHNLTVSFAPPETQSKPMNKARRPANWSDQELFILYDAVKAYSHDLFNKNKSENELRHVWHLICALASTKGLQKTTSQIKKAWLRMKEVALYAYDKYLNEYRQISDLDMKIVELLQSKDQNKAKGNKKVCSTQVGAEHEPAENHKSDADEIIEMPLPLLEPKDIKVEMLDPLEGGCGDLIQHNQTESLEFQEEVVTDEPYVIYPSDTKDVVSNGTEVIHTINGVPFKTVRLLNPAPAFVQNFENKEPIRHEGLESEERPKKNKKDKIGQEKNGHRSLLKGPRSRWTVKDVRASIIKESESKNTESAEKEEIFTPTTENSSNDVIDKDNSHPSPANKRSRNPSQSPTHPGEDEVSEDEFLMELKSQDYLEDMQSYVFEKKRRKMSPNSHETNSKSNDKPPETENSNSSKTESNDDESSQQIKAKNGRKRMTEYELQVLKLHKKRIEVAIEHEKERHKKIMAVYDSILDKLKNSKFNLTDLFSFD